MKRFIILLLSALSFTAFAQDKKVAVYVIGEDAGINKVLGNKLVSAITKSEEFSAIERTASFLAELYKEQKYQRTGAVDDSDISRLGKQFGVQYVCVATVSKVFDEDYISARLIDVESAQVERTASSNGTIQSLDDIIIAANDVSKELFSSFRKWKKSNLPKVAVYVVKNDAEQNICKVLGDKLVAGFANSGRYIAIERTNSFLTQLSKEQKYQRKGAVDENDISRLGKQFGVQYVCVTEITDVLGKKFISARLIDVETAEIVNSYDAGGLLNNMNSCLKMADKIASNLSKGTFAEQNDEAELIEADEEEEEVIFVVVESMPEFPGGQQALFKYLSENVRFPVFAQEEGIQGRVVCQFVVDRDGSIVNVKVVRSSGVDVLNKETVHSCGVDSINEKKEAALRLAVDAFDKEAVRVIKSMPKWKPGKQRGRPVPVKYTVPINFKLQ